MKLLIVDDQPGVTEGLCHGVNWAQLGFSQVRAVNSVREARAAIEKLCNVLNCAPNDIFEFDDITNNKSNYNPVEPSSNEYHIFRNYCIDTSQIKDLDDYFDRKIDEKLKNLNVNISTKKDSEE